MSSSDGLQALVKIKTEIDQSNIKINISEECYKTQLRIYRRLKETRKARSAQYALQLKEYENVKNNILEAEKTKESLMKQIAAMKESSIESTQNLLLLKERNSKAALSMQEKIKKYQTLWSQCKKRYESLPLVSEWFAMKKTGKNLKERIASLENEKSTLIDNIRSKKKQIENTEQTLIIQFSDFMVRGRPQLLEAIENKKAQIMSIKMEMEKIVNNKKRSNNNVTLETPLINKRLKLNPESSLKHDLPLFPVIKQHDINMPNVPKVPKDLFAIDSEIKVTENKIPKSIISLNITAPSKEDTFKRPAQEDSWISRYFVSRFAISQEKPEHGSSNKKQIRIIDDVTINNVEARTLVSTINSKSLKYVDTIGANAETEIEEHAATENDVHNMGTDYTSQQMEIFEDANNALVPPTQFRDERAIVVEEVTDVIMEGPTNIATPDKETSEPTHTKPAIVQDTPIMPQEVHSSTQMADDTKIANNIGSSDDSYAKMKESYLKTHNLDLSPQFTYARNPLHKKKDDETALRFFKISKCVANTQEGQVNNNEAVINQQPPNEIAPTQNEHSVENIDDTPAINESLNSQTYIFNGKEGILESLDVMSMSVITDDGCTEYQGIDSSLLLSPKADLQEDTEQNVGQLPNFLSRLQSKVPFLGNASNEDPKPGNSAQDTGDDFSFNFGAKPNRGGFFNLFR